MHVLAACSHLIGGAASVAPWKCPLLQLLLWTPIDRRSIRRLRHFHQLERLMLLLIRLILVLLLLLLLVLLTVLLERVEHLAQVLGHQHESALI